MLKFIRKKYNDVREWFRGLRDIWEYSAHGQFGLLDDQDETTDPNRKKPS